MAPRKAVNDWTTVEPNDWQDVGESTVPALVQQKMPQPSPAKPGFFSALASNIGIPESVQQNPMEGLQGIGMAIDNPSLLGQSLMEMGKGALQSHLATAQKGWQELTQPGEEHLKGAIRMGLSAVPMVGPAVANAADMAAKGNIPDSNLPGAAGGLAALVAPKAIESVGGVPSMVRRGMVGPQKAVFPEIANWSTPAVEGAEQIFKVAAPVGGDPMFRKSLYAAGGDLAEIGRKVNLQEAKGGIINPDMRVRATVNAMNDHLNETYQTELAPQIQRNANAAVVPKFSADAKGGLEYMARSAGTEADRALAAKAASGQTLTLSEANSLREATNKELSPLRGMTPQELAQVEGTSRRLGSLQALDKEVVTNIGDELARRGEPGIKEYEQRYAAVSTVRTQLEKRMNSSELNQPGMVRAALKPIVSAVTGGKSGIASASQAAVADVNMGRALQKGLQKLADSELVAQRGVGTGAPPIKGLLTPGAHRIPSSMEGIPAPVASHLPTYIIKNGVQVMAPKVTR